MLQLSPSLPLLSSDGGGGVLLSSSPLLGCGCSLVFANNNNNNGSSSKTRPSCVPVPYPAGVIYCEEDRDKERAELELLQKRYVELVDFVHRLAHNKKILPSEHRTQAITSKTWMRK